MMSYGGVCLDEWSKRGTEEERYLSLICLIFALPHNSIALGSVRNCHQFYELQEKSKCGFFGVFVCVVSKELMHWCCSLMYPLTKRSLIALQINKLVFTDSRPTGSLL